MMTPTKLTEFVERQMSKGFDKPIYLVMLFNGGAKEAVFPAGTPKAGKPTGFPDITDKYCPAFYYSMNAAIQAVTENICDIRENIYNEAFVLCRFQGMYSYAGPHERLYYTWDSSLKKFVLAEEPELLQRVAY